jgi:hypothetical protein
MFTGVLYGFLPTGVLVHNSSCKQIRPVATVSKSIRTVPRSTAGVIQFEYLGVPAGYRLLFDVAPGLRRPKTSNNGVISSRHPCRLVSDDRDAVGRSAYLSSKTERQRCRLTSPSSISTGGPPWTRASLKADQFNSYTFYSKIPRVYR